MNILDELDLDAQDDDVLTTCETCGGSGLREVSAPVTDAALRRARLKLSDARRLVQRHQRTVELLERRRDADA